MTDSGLVRKMLNFAKESTVPVPFALDRKGREVVAAEMLCFDNENDAYELIVPDDDKIMSIRVNLNDIKHLSDGFRSSKWEIKFYAPTEDGYEERHKALNGGSSA